jgi:hypothetical protein
MKPPTLPKACSQYGASMGRSNVIAEPDEIIKFHIYRMRMVDGDYDIGGAYWGGGHEVPPMWHAYGDGPEQRNEMFVRGWTRDEVKLKVIEDFAFAKFYRQEVRRGRRRRLAGVLQC